MVFIILNFLVLHLAENFMIILNKIEKLPLHENLQKHVNQNMLSFTFYAHFHEILWKAQSDLGP